MNYEKLYYKYKHKYLNLKYKLDGGIFELNGGILYIMMDIIDDNITKNLNTLKKEIFPNSNENKEYHITLFDINFNINYINFKNIKKIIKSVDFIKYVNKEFKKINDNLKLNIKDSYKILGRIFESGYDGRFITLNFEEHENNGILIKQFRNNIIRYILNKININYNENNFYPEMRNINNEPKENNFFWIYSNKHISNYKKTIKDKWIKNNVIFAIKKFNYPFQNWTPHISILSFQELNNQYNKIKGSIDNILNKYIKKIIFKNLNVEIFISLRIKNEQSLNKNLIYKKINSNNEIFYGDYELIYHKSKLIKLKNLNLENLVEGDHTFIERDDHNVDNYDYYKLILNKNSIISNGKIKKINNKPNNIVYVHYDKKNNS